MKYIKVNELIEQDNDIYFLETCSNKIIINDNYKGIKVLSNDLKIIKQIPLFEDIIIYSAYKNICKSSILLYCPDNECMVLVNLDSGDSNMIKLTGEFASVNFSELYSWEENEIILADYNNNFYKIDFVDCNITYISNHTLQVSYRSFYKFWMKSLEYKIIKIDGNQFIFDDNKQKKIGTFDYIKDISLNIQCTDFEWHDVIYKNNLFVFIQEEGVCLALPSFGKREIKAISPFYFLKAKFLHDTQPLKLLILSSDKSNVSISKLAIYAITI